MTDRPPVSGEPPSDDFEDMLAGLDRIINDKELQQKLLDAGLLVRIEDSPPPVSGEPSTEALAFLIQYHRRQAEQIHREREGGLHSGESWTDCSSLICRNTQWDIDKALAIEALARATPPSLDVERLAEAGGNVLDGRRIGSVRLYRNTITPDDWSAIAAEYLRLASGEERP